MSLKTISIGALARAMAATSVLGATLIPAAVSAQQLSAAQQAQALAQAIATAVENAAQNSTADNAEANIQLAIQNAIDGADPAIAQAALTQAQTLVSNALPTLNLSSSVVAAITGPKGAMTTAFTAVNNTVTAQLTSQATGAVGKGNGGQNNGKGNGGQDNGNGNGGRDNGVGNGGAPGGGSPGGAGGGGGGGGGGGSHL